MTIRVTVCLCTFRRPALSNALQSLVNQIIPDGVTMDVVVADNDPHESGRPIVESYAKEGSLPITYVVAHEPGVASARNCSVANARGEWLAFIDDDEEADVDWVQALLKCAEAHQASVVIGPVIACYPSEAPSWIVNGDFFGKRVPASGTQLGTGATCNALVRKDALPDQLCPFSLEFNTTGGEDTEMFSQMVSAGHRIVSCQEARVTETVEPHRLNEDFLLRKARRVGETYARIFISPKGIALQTIDIVRACIQTLVASVISLMLHPLGMEKSMHYKIKAYANLGKLLHMMKRNPIELYKG
nr:glycosyltransferase family 2 protein [Methylotenera mobilis]